MNAYVPHVKAIADFADEDQQLGSKYVLIEERIFAFNHNQSPNSVDGKLQDQVLYHESISNHDYIKDKV